jgi:thiamine biosynthesis lipoprotein
MISSRRSARRTSISRLVGAFAILFITATLFPLRAQAQGGVKLFQRQFMAGRSPAVILIVGWQKDQESVERLMDVVSQRAAETFARLDWMNPASDVSRINANAGAAPVQVSADVAEAFAEAKKISEWTKGAFDITYAGSGSYKDIKAGKDSVELKKSGMQARFDPLMDGFLAEYMIRMIHTAGMQNAMVKVGNVFRGMGSGISGPWKIQVQDDAGTYAHHALNLVVSNAGIATASASQYRGTPLIDPKSKSAITPSCKGTTIVMKNAAEAQGVAYAVFVLGPQKGYEMITKLGNARGLIVDNNGKFIRTPGF